MLPYALLRGVSKAAEAFFGRLEQQEVTAYTSALTFDELAYRLILALVKDQYGGSPLERYRNEQAAMLAEFSPRVVAALQQLRTYANLQVLDVIAADLEQTNESMVQFQMQPRDALHYAAMVRVGCFELASNDAHFDRVPTITRFTF